MFRRSSLAVLTLGALSALALLAGCGRSIAPVQPKSSGFGTVSLTLVDGPAQFDHIYLDVTEVWVHRLDDQTVGNATSGEDSGPNSLQRRGAHPQSDDRGSWHQLEAATGTYDLLDLENNVLKTLAVGSVPSGTYDQVRLKLGADNTIVVDGVTYPLKVPSGQESGYKLYGLFEVPVDGTVNIGIDFNPALSVHQTGSGTWMLVPSARIVPIQTTGNIHGTVSPASATSTVYAMMGADTVTSTLTGGDGGFTLSLLPEGDYAVHIVPTIGGLRDTTLSPVHVTVGQTTELGTIEIGGTAFSFGDEFNGSALSSLWQAASWQGGGGATVGGGIASIDGFGVTSNATFGPGNSVEFVATFGADAFENVGFATGAAFDAPWVTVGTGTSGAGVFARSSTSSDVSLGAGLIGSPHRYRIDWSPTGFAFSVDGVQVTTIAATVGSVMNVELSDFNPNALTLDVDWLHVTPLAAPASPRAASAMRSAPSMSLVRQLRR